MISDVLIGGVLIPGLLAIACLALALTMVVLRLLTATSLSRWLVFSALVELAVFVILFGLLAHVLPAIGPLP